MAGAGAGLARPEARPAPARRVLAQHDQRQHAAQTQNHRFQHDRGADPGGEPEDQAEPWVGPAGQVVDHLQTHHREQVIEIDREGPRADDGKRGDADAKREQRPAHRQSEPERYRRAPCNLARRLVEYLHRMNGEQRRAHGEAGEPGAACGRTGQTRQ